MMASKLVRRRANCEWVTNFLPPMGKCTLGPPACIRRSRIFWNAPDGLKSFQNTSTLSVFKVNFILCLASNENIKLRGQQWSSFEKSFFFYQRGKEHLFLKSKLHDSGFEFWPQVLPDIIFFFFFAPSLSPSLSLSLSHTHTPSFSIFAKAILWKKVFFSVPL